MIFTKWTYVYVVLSYMGTSIWYILLIFNPVGMMYDEPVIICGKKATCSSNNEIF